MSASPNPRLTRDKNEGMLGGVCAGIAARYGYDLGLVRLIWVLATVLTGGTGIVIYVAAWVLLPAADAATSSPSMGDRRREFSGEVTAAAERAAEAARIAAAHARQAADEIAAVARGVSHPAPATPAAEVPTPETPAPPPAAPSAQPPIDPPAAGAQQP